MPKKSRSKTAIVQKVKQKTSVSQKVIINVTKRRGPTKRTGPTQSQQLIQSLVPLFAQRAPLIQTAQPFQPSAQQLQQLIERLGQPGPQGPQGPPGERGLYGPQGPRGFPGYISNINISDGFRTPSLESVSDQGSIGEFAFKGLENLEKGSPLASSSGKSFVLDLPDVPLIQPDRAIIPAGPERLDNPHEDVPLQEGKEEAKEEALSEEEEPYLSPFAVPPIASITKDFLNSLPNTTKQKGNKVTLRMIRDAYGLILTGSDYKNKEAVVDALWRQIQERKTNPSMASSAPK